MTNPTALLVRMAAVAALGVAAVDRLNQLTPTFVVGDATAFVTLQVQTLAHVSLKLIMLGHDVVVFVLW